MGRAESGGVAPVLITFSRRLPVLGTALLLSACSATVDWNYKRTPSNAFAHPETTSVGALFQEAADEHPGLSGFHLLREGSVAFMARLAMADLAEKTLDGQYYIWDGDTSGLILADRLLRAADRGVRVRLLIDDNYMTGTRDFNIAAFDSHPNVEIRFFNPVNDRSRRIMSFVANFGRLNHRMHNKLFIMDNALGIVGGRNIADVYFGVRTDHNYRDLDVVTAGPIVDELSGSFDLFWNSEWSIPVGAVVKEHATEEDLRSFRTRLENELAAAGYPYPIDERIADLRGRLVQIRDEFVWAPGMVLVEHPSKVNEDADNVIATALGQRTSEVERELLVESPYFVLNDRNIETIRRLKAREVKVRVLTNSAPSNDVLAAHAGYSNTRKQLLQAGLELYELRPDSNMKRDWSLLAGKSRAALHAKSLVFDRKSVFIGSFNLDPRSTNLNTEIGVMIDSPELAGQVAEMMDEGVSSGSAFHVTLDEDENLMWTAEDDEARVEYEEDPETSIWYRFLVGVIGALPIEDQL
jgi:cardiolipin synthase C